MSVQTFMEEFRQCQRWIRGYRVIADGAALAEVIAREDCIYIGALMVPSSERGRGQGRAGLTFLLNMADRHDVIIRSHVARFGSSKAGLGQRDLRAWYKRSGFMVMRNGLMCRMPNAASPTVYVKARKEDLPILLTDKYADASEQMS